MRILQVEWPRGIREKIQWKHGLEQEEVESAVVDRRAKIKKAGAARYVLLGRSSEGAYISAFFTYRHQVARIISARRMDVKERRLYSR